MTKLQFVGDLPLWAGLLLAFLVGVMCWRYYRRESFDLSPRLRWMLPLLRSLAFVLGVLVLTQPVLHHRKVIGELGNVKIYVDASQSMGLLDRHLSDGRKLLIAEQQGWLENGVVDASPLDLANDLSDARLRTLAELQQDSLSAADVARLREALLTILKTTRSSPAFAASSKSDNGADGGAVSADSFTTNLMQPLEAVSTTGDQASLAAAVSQLNLVCVAILPIEEQLRRAFETEVQQRVSVGDESVRAALAMFDDTPRWRRAERSLLETSDALFADLKQHHNVEILALHNQQAVELWDGLNAAEPPKQFFDSPDAATSDLATGISSSQKVAMNRDSSAAESSDVPATAVSSEAESLNLAATANTAVVLLTDGQHNSGPSPLQAARILGSQGVAFYPVSMGAIQQAPDISVTGLEHPEMVFQKDRVRGTMMLYDQMPAGQSFVAEVRYEDEILWQQSLLTQNSGERRIDFEFSVDELVQRIGSQFDSNVQRNAVALAMTASVAPLQGEAEPDNNQRTMRFAAITQNYRLLILDGRPRWEIRYLRNVFERDSQWDVDVIIAGPGNDEVTLPRGDGDDRFPATRDGLFEYDLIVFGELDPEIFTEHEFAWMRDFVEVRGGGMVFVDGNRKRLSRLSEQNLGSLLPVEWLPASIARKPSMLQLTEKGSREPALAFEIDSPANKRFWNELPPPHSLNSVQTLPGAEVLVEAIVDGSAMPVMVTRTFGAGRVLYLAADETWRWRYKAADTYHQRIWNQLAKYVMPRPFATSDDFLSVDTGPVSYKNGDSANIRIRLMGLDGKPATDATVDALVRKDGRIVSTASLTADPDVPGIYRGTSGAMTEGDYEVSIQASGFSQEALKARGQFVVLPAESNELQKTACNESLLKQMATASGGVYLREEQIGRLSTLLSPLSSGRVVESDTQIWQSYWWFAAIVFLLSLEWLLRKRVGLL